MGNHVHSLLTTDADLGITNQGAKGPSANQINEYPNASNGSFGKTSRTIAGYAKTTIFFAISNTLSRI